MGQVKVEGRNLKSPHRKQVLLVDEDAQVIVKKGGSYRWILYSFGILTLMIFSGALGAWMNSKASISPEQRVEDAAKLLGIPLNGKSLAGITFVSSNGPRSSMTFSHACLNCGYDGMAITLQYPEEPGIGWRKHDRPVILEALNATQTAQAEER